MADDSEHEFDGIELADAVESVRKQLLAASAQGVGKEITFTVEDIQMEFTVELRKELKGGLKVKAWVVEAGADAGRSTGSTHKVSLTLKPKVAETGESLDVSNLRPGDVSGFGDVD
ncbi:trypco2 family protein [Streptomyces sp. NPDC004111]|uniref:trypco2 family protein n=1 Tax=Streptomyces sp. NPDC004111 TaxID=3364690 RepID=UPI0036CF59A1